MKKTTVVTWSSQLKVPLFLDTNSWCARAWIYRKSMLVPVLLDVI